MHVGAMQVTWGGVGKTGEFSPSSVQRNEKMCVWMAGGNRVKPEIGVVKKKN